MLIAKNASSRKRMDRQDHQQDGHEQRADQQHVARS